MRAFCLFLCSGLLLFGCSNSDGLKYNVVLNPYKHNPLGAEIQFENPFEGSLQIELIGSGEPAVSLSVNTEDSGVPILGLFADTENKVVLKFEGNGITEVDTVVLKTDPLPEDLPSIEIEIANELAMTPGMHLCDMHLANDGKFNTTPIIFDNKGNVRWMLELSQYESGMMSVYRLPNGNYTMGAGHKVYEFSPLGEIVALYKLDSKWWIHHEILPLKNGNLLLAVSKKGSKITLEDGSEKKSDHDWIIEYDMNQRAIVREWDVALIMDVRRDNLFMLGGKGNWLHMNALEYDYTDNSIIVSGKHQGVFKMRNDGSLVWILAPHENWGMAGRNADAFDTNDFLLRAVNAEGVAYSDSVQLGYKSPSDFDFPWGQHAPLLLPNGNVFLFDNGFERNFIEEPNYSRAVEYEIDEEKMEVKQVWQYGKERGESFFSKIICDVDYLEESENVLVTSGFILEKPDPNEKMKNSGRIVELAYRGDEPVFEAVLRFKNTNGNGTFAWAQFDVLYRSERLTLYPEQAK